MISHTELLDRLDYNPESGVFTWKTKKITNQYDKTWNAKHAGNQTGYTRKNGYKVIILNNKEYPCSRLAWFYVYKKWPTNEVDHINLNPLDNRIVNLRDVTRSENAINRGLQSNNTSGFKGVWKRSKSNSWVAGICINGIRKKLGDFKSPELAYEAYKREAMVLHKGFARL